MEKVEEFLCFQSMYVSLCACLLEPLSRSRRGQPLGCFCLFHAIAENEELGGPLGCFWKTFWKRNGRVFQKHPFLFGSDGGNIMGVQCVLSTGSVYTC